MTGKHVLAFEADPIYAELITSTLSGLGHEVEVVPDGVDGLDRAIANPPDVIYLCVELPRISGFSVCMKLRKNPMTQNIPIVITSGEATDETFEKHRNLKQVRADEYLHKPFNRKKLIDALTPFLGAPFLNVESDEILIEESTNTYDSSDEFKISDASTEFSLSDVEEISVEDVDEEDVEKTDVGHTVVEDKIDEEIDAFTNDAFFANLADDSESKSPVEPKAQAPQRTEAITAPPPPTVTPRTTTEAPAYTATAELQAELERLLAEKSELEDKLMRQERELTDARAARPAGGSSASIREILALREQFNRKDRDLLDMKEGANKKDKQLLEYRERISKLERDNADANDKSLVFDKQVNDFEERIKRLGMDKDLLIKKAEDLQDRIEHFQSKIHELQNNIDEERTERKADFERLTAEKHEAVRLAAAESEVAMEQAVSSLRAELEATSQGALAAQHAELEKARENALAAQQTKLQQAADADKQQSLIDQRKRHERELAAAKGELTASHETKTAEVAREHEATTKRLESDLENREQSIGRLAEERDGLLSSQRQLTTQNGALTQALEESQRKVAAVVLERDSARMEYGETLATLEGTAATLSETNAELAERNAELEQTRQELAAEQERGASLKDAIRLRNQQIAELDGELISLGELTMRNDSMIEKAKQALAITAKLIDEYEPAATDDETEETVEDDE